MGTAAAEAAPGIPARTRILVSETDDVAIDSRASGACLGVIYRRQKDWGNERRILEAETVAFNPPAGDLAKRIERNAKHLAG